MAATSEPSPAGIRITENQWRGTIALLSAAVLLITVWCLVNGITIIFMHLYYFPIVLLAYRYRWTGFWLSSALALAYLLLVAAFDPGQPDVLSGALFRALVFLGIAGVIAFIAGRLYHANDALLLNAARTQALLDLHRISHAPFRQILDLSLESARKISGSRYSFIGLLDDTEAEMTIHAWSRDAMADCTIRDKPLHFPVREAGIWGECVRTRQPFVQNDYRHAHPAKHGYPDGHVPITRFMGIPIEDTGRIVAVIGVANKESEYTGDDIQAVTMLGNQMWELFHRKRAEEELVRSGTIHRSYIEHSPVAIFVAETSGRYVDVNPAACRLLGYSRDELLARNVTDLAFPGKEDEIRSQIARVNEELASKTVVTFEIGLRKKDGGACLVILSVVRLPAGTIMGHAVDITEQKQMAKALKKSEKRYEHLFESMQEGFAYCRMIYDEGGAPSDFIYLAVNPAFDRIIGTSTVTNKPVTKIFPGIRDAFPQLFEIYGRVARTGVPESFEIEFWPVKKWLNISVYSPQKDHFVAVFTDITDRKTAQDRIRELMIVQQEQLRIINASPAVSFLWRAEENWPVEMVSDNIAQFGYTPDDFLSGRILFSAIIHPDDLARIGAEVEYNSSNHIDEYKQVYRILGADRTEYWIDDFTHIRRDGTGRITHYEGIIVDITDRKRAEDAVIESEQKFREIFDNANDAIEIVGIRDDGSPGRFIDLNAVACRMLQYTKDELLGRGPLDITTETFSRPFEEILAELHTTGHATFETGHQRKDGTVFPVEVNAHIVTLLGKKVILSVVRDITERRAAEAEIRRSRQLFADIISFLPDPTVVIDKGGKVLAWNQAIEKLSGVPAEDIIGRGDHTYSIWLYGKRRPILIDLVLHPDQDAGRMNYLNIRRKGSTLTAETTATLQSGKHVVLSLVASPLYGENGEITGAIESMRDITAIKETEAELARINANLEKIVRERTQALQDEIVQRKYAEAEAQDALAYTRSVIEANPDMMVVLDAGGRILDINAAGTILTGIPREDLLGQPYFGYLEDDGTLETAFDRLLAEGSIENFVRIRHLDGHRIPLSVHAVVVKGSGGAPDRIIVSAHDITKQKADEAAIKASLEEKVILLREIHHRVKNNLQIIISLTNLQMRKAADPLVKQMMAETQNRVRAMSLVHEKLYSSESLSRIDFADYARFLATQLMSFYTIDTRRVNLEVTHQKMMVDINTAVPLGLIMNELVSNALKHAFPDGRAGTLSISGGIVNGTLAITIQDDGVGLPGGVDWRNSGTLGMQLVLGLVDQIGGTMTVEQGNGTRFTITIKDIREME